MKRILLCCIFSISVLATGYAQSDAINWVNKNAHPLHADTASTLADLAFFSGVLKNNRVLGLGEASHGTKEFYNQKKRIIKYLITDLNYRSLGFEFSASSMEAIDQYVQNGKGDLKDLMKDLFLYNTAEIYDVFELIRQHNERQPVEGKVSIFGFDKRDFWHDPYNRDRFMADLIIGNYNTRKTKTIIWAHNVHLAKDTTMAGLKAMGAFLKDSFAEKYYVLGFDTFQGSVTVINGREFIKHNFQAAQNSYSKLFAEAKYENFFISFDRSPNPFSGSKNYITHINSNWTATRALPIRPGIDFNAILFLRNTNATVKLE